MEKRTSEEVREGVEDFTKEYLQLLKAKKTIDLEIKELKDGYKERGIAVGIVCKAINKLKTDLKKSDSEKFEQDTIQDWLESSDIIVSDISDLNAK